MRLMRCWKSRFSLEGGFSFLLLYCYERRGNCSALVGVSFMGSTIGRLNRYRETGFEGK